MLRPCLGDGLAQIPHVSVAHVVPCTLTIPLAATVIHRSQEIRGQFWIRNQPHYGCSTQESNFLEPTREYVPSSARRLHHSRSRLVIHADKVQNQHSISLSSKQALRQH